MLCCLVHHSISTPIRVDHDGGLGLVAVGLTAFAAYPSAALYILGYGLISGIGIAAANYHVISATIARLIEDRHGLAIGIADSGSTVGQVTTVPLLTMALNFAGMMGAGYLADKVNRPLLLGFIYLARSISFIVLIKVGMCYELLTLFAFIFGIFDYSTMPVHASLVASHFSLRAMDLSMGLISGGHALGGALGPFRGGYLFDVFLRYSEMWWTTFSLAIIEGLMCFFILENRVVSPLALDRPLRSQVEFLGKFA